MGSGHGAAEDTIITAVTGIMAIPVVAGKRAAGAILHGATTGTAVTGDKFNGNPIYTLKPVIIR
jgi:hypothetical protein